MFEMRVQRGREFSVDSYDLKPSKVFKTFKTLIYPTSFVLLLFLIFSAESAEPGRVVVLGGDSETVQSNAADSETRLALYLRHVEETVAPETLRAYEKDLTRFFLYLRGAGHSTDLPQITEEVIREYIASLQGDYEKATISRKIACLKSYFKYWMRKGVITKNPMAQIASPIVIVKRPQALTIEQIKLLLDAPSSTELSGLRDRALLMVLYAGALKVSEAAKLNIGDINLENGMLRVKKGRANKERVLPLPLSVDELDVIGTLREYLNAFLKTLPSDPSKEAALFLTRFNERLTDRSVRKIVKKHALRVGLEKKVGSSPSVLRHSRALHLLAWGKCNKEMQILLGHKCLNTTVSLYCRENLKAARENAED